VTVEISSISGIRVGANSPLIIAHEKARKKGGEEIPAHLTFSLMSQEEDKTLMDFVCENERQFSEWLDGFVQSGIALKADICTWLTIELVLRFCVLHSFRAAMDQEMAQKDTVELISSMSAIEVKIKTVDIRLHHVAIADAPPPVPPPPSNYDFQLPLESL